MERESLAVPMEERSRPSRDERERERSMCAKQPRLLKEQRSNAVLPRPFIERMMQRLSVTAARLLS
jgi:hypothetical protein